MIIPLIACAISISLAVPPAQTAAPANDRCVDALILAQGGGGFSTAGAAPDGGSSCAIAANSPDIWFLLVPQTSGIATVSACAYTSSTMDPVLSAHFGCPGTSANEIACNDNTAMGGSCGPASAQIHFAVTAGRPAWIRLAGANGSAGPAWVSASGVTLPPAINNLPETALDVDRGEHLGLMGTVPTGLPSCVGTYGSFYHYTPSTSGPVTASTCGPYWTDTTMSVFDGTTLLGCCDDCCADYQSSVTWPALGGHQYTIRIGDWWGPIEEPFRFYVNGPPRAAESCATAGIQPYGTRLVELGQGPASGSSTCDAAIPDTAWYGRVVATCDGVLSISTCGTNDLYAVDTGPDTRISLHSGCPADASTEIACSNDALGCGGQHGAAFDAAIYWPVTNGDAFVVRVTRDPRSSRTLPVQLTIECESSDLLCAGDGSGAPCPCGNTGLAHRGCDNSASTGGSLLTKSGTSSLSADTVTLHGVGTTTSGTGLYFQGTTSIAGGSGLAFGDGLRCAGGIAVRLGVRTSVAGSSSFGANDGSGASVSVAGGIPIGGGTRYYQLWYRDALPYCTALTFNLGNAVRLVWVP